MLTEIQCDEFKSNGVPRNSIFFHKGLNAVVGNESGTNSVGKSTFLMILDFVFGGTDYTEKAKEVHNNVQPHAIKFRFDFDGEQFFFVRSTADSNFVSRCNKAYEEIDRIKLEDYLQFLKEKYKLQQDDLSFRGAVGRFIRVYRRETLSEEKPLASAIKESDADALLGALKLFDEYSTVVIQKKMVDEAVLKEKVFKAAQKYDFIRGVSNQNEYIDNCKQIELLNTEVTEILANNNSGLLELNGFQAEQLRNIKSKLASLRSQRSYYKTQLDKINISRNDSAKITKKKFDALLQFFPNTDVRKLEQIECFHKTLSTILKDEFTESSNDLEDMILMLTEEIATLEKEQTTISVAPNVEQAVLERYANLKFEVQRLENENLAYEQKKAMHNVVKEENEKLDKLIVEKMAYIEQKINNSMELLNEKLYDMPMKAPLFHVENSKKYSFYTPDDGGTGVRYKGLILFDLAILRESNLPFVIHDSVLLLQIENEVVEKLLELYAEEKEKQIFIAFDKISTEKEEKLLKDAEVIHLSRGGNELFGYSWNKKGD